MNRPDSAGEPSMEEILASIRQIVADGPSGEKPVAEVPANPLVPRSAGLRNGSATPPGVSAPPSLDKLSNVLKNGSVPSAGPFGSKRPLPFDQDLADMLDDPASQDAASLAPKPDIRVAPELLVSASKPAEKTEAEEKPAAHASVSDVSGLSDVSGTDAPKSDASRSDALLSEALLSDTLPSDTLALNGAAALPPQLQPSSAPHVAPEQVPPPPFGAAEIPAPPRNTSFPPLRTKGFFPSQPPPPPTRPLGMDIGPAPSAAAAIAAHSGEPPAPAALQGYEATSGPGLGHSFTGSPLNGEGFYGATPQPPHPFGAAPAYHPSEPAIEPAQVFAEPVEALREARPFPGAASADPSIAAAQALDALAQGLAASAAHSAAGSPTPLRLADPTEQLVRSALAIQQPEAPARTLEDAVADMLRPMLQQWVAENMPRIIERALRTEVANTVKPGSKPPGY